MLIYFVSAVLSSKVAEVGTEVDNVLPLLEAKEFTVDASTLITVQHLIQWTVTFILRLLTSLPDWRAGNTPRGTLVSFFIIIIIKRLIVSPKKISSTIYFGIQSCSTCPVSCSLSSGFGV